MRIRNIEANPFPGLLFLWLLSSPGWAGGCVAWGTSSARPLAETAAVIAQAGAPGEPLALALTIDYQGPEGRDAVGTRQVREAAEEVFAASGRFRLVQRAEGGWTLALHLASEKKERVWLTVLCVLSATILPAMVTEDLVITATLRSPAGVELGQRQLTMQQTSMVELFALFGMPFAYESGVRDDLFRAVIADLLAWAGELVRGAAPAAAPGP